ncbi:MAG: diaminopimelate epimerase [bacterium]|nr:diaminopimelate epimerase [bacterium]
MNHHLFKVEATGNDFILGIGPWSKTLQNDSALVSRLCDRRRGIGADGSLAVEKLGADAIRVHYRNADGGVALFCANGMRCAARVANEHLGVGPSLVIENGWTEIGATVRDANVILELPGLNPESRTVSVEADGCTWTGWLLEVGVPHFVVPVDFPVEQIDVAGLGGLLRHNELFGPEGTNVNFVSSAEANVLSVRTFERGVEGETLSCGSGVVASAVHHMRKHDLQSVDCLTRSGDLLRVEDTGCQGYRPLHLCGPARVIAEFEPSRELLEG